MAKVVSNLGEEILLDWMLKDESVTDDVILKLYKSNTTPTATSTPGSFTECDFTNYVEKTIARADWTAADTNGDGKAESSSDELTWTCGASGNTVYGYWVETDEETPVLLWAELFGTARVLANGDSLNLTPKMTLSSE